MNTPLNFLGLQHLPAPVTYEYSEGLHLSSKDESDSEPRVYMQPTAYAETCLNHHGSDTDAAMPPLDLSVSYSVPHKRVENAYEQPVPVLPDVEETVPHHDAYLDVAIDEEEASSS